MATSTKKGSSRRPVSGSRRRKIAVETIPAEPVTVPTSAQPEVQSESRSFTREPIRRLTVEQFATLVAAFVSEARNRRLVEVHLHHTWRPRHAEFRGRTTVEAMRRYHVETAGFSDIAQHLTIDPAGGLWTGRSWNAPPASSAGRNGTFAQGPFMIEIVGDFDLGQDPFDGVQKRAVIECVAILLLATPDVKVKFHRELGSPKSCPGTSIEKAPLVELIDRRVEELATAPRARADRRAIAPFGVAPTEGETLYRSLKVVPGKVDPPSAEVPEHGGVSLRWNDLVGPSRVEVRVPHFGAAGERVRSDEEWSELRPHVVNLSKGRLSTGGTFDMDPGSIDAIVDGLRGYALTTANPVLMLFAHGGLVAERKGLAYAKSTRAWWQNHGVYPIYFVWETGFLDTILQGIVGPRDLTDLTDAAIETTSRPIGLPLWTAMKTSARLASSSDTGDGWPGGAWQFVQALRKALAELADAGHAMGVHCVGHSAGSIFHSHLLPLLGEQGVAVDSLSLLAPAVRVDRFKELIAPLKEEGRLKRIHMFTMNEEAELADTVGPLYRKSLLYLVSRAYEPKDRTPILGLQASIDADPALATWIAKHVELQYSRPTDVAPNPLTQATAHGAFDNDRFTMSAVLRRIKGVIDPANEGQEGQDDFPQEESSRAAEPIAPVAATMVGSTVAVPVVRSGAGPAGRRRALCVGIDSYSIRPLAGCVSDARLWASTLGQVGFEVSLLLDRSATLAAISEALRALVKDARDGDVIVFQYAGHGTQVEDANADEEDGFDEAFVPIDFDRGNLLLDDDIAEIVRGIPRNVVLTLFMDCCHSGTISRFSPTESASAGTDERVRYLPLPKEVARAHAESRRGQRATGPAPQSLPGVVHYAACRDDEFAWETQGQGDFTRSATKHLARAIAGGMTNEALLQQIRTDLAARGRQHPGLMRLPANLRERTVLSSATGVRAEEAAVTGANGSDEALLAAAEALVAGLRSRLAR